MRNTFFSFHNTDHDTCLTQNRYFNSNNIYTIPGNTGFYLSIIFKMKLAKQKFRKKNT